MATLLTPTARLAASPDGLSAVQDEDCNLAVWERAANPAFASLLKVPVASARFNAPVSDLRARILAQVAQAGYPKTSARTALIDDIVSLAERYASLMKLDAVSVRLAIVTSDSCRKFHADYVKARLITTYVGTGTQWIDGKDAERVARGQDPARINTLGAGDVGLFKGKIATRYPAIHRSPPIAGTGETRLMLVLDPARDD